MNDDWRDPAIEAFAAAWYIAAGCRKNQMNPRWEFVDPVIRAAFRKAARRSLEHGLDDLSDALDEARSAASVEAWIEDLTFDAFNAIIRLKLDATYPAPYFEAEQYGVLWRGELNGTDIDPGVRWATLLRLALRQLDVSK